MRKRQIIVVAAMLLGLVVLPATAAADTSTNTSTEDNTSTLQTEPPQGNPPESGQVKTDVSKFRQEAIQMLQTDRKDLRLVHTALQRQKACEAHQAAINQRVSNYAKAAQTNLDTFNSIFTKVQAFYADKKLDVANYSTLLATAQAQQTAAQQAVDALKSLDVTIDCTQPDPAQTLATVKTAVVAARTALQSYRSSIKDIITALEGASSAQNTNTTTTGGDQ